jgi:hypothetical protein
VFGSLPAFPQGEGDRPKGSPTGWTLCPPTAENPPRDVSAETLAGRGGRDSIPTAAELREGLIAVRSGRVAAAVPTDHQRRSRASTVVSGSRDGTPDSRAADSIRYYCA